MTSDESPTRVPVVSVHLAEVGPRRALPAVGTSVRRRPGLLHARLTTLAPLGGSLLPHPNPGRIGLIAAWEDETALERFLLDDPLAALLAGGWRATLAPTHVFGSWPPLDPLVQEGLEMEDEEPAAVLTIGHLRPSQTLRFLRASARAEELARESPGLLLSTGLARPPLLVATFSLWRTRREMLAYARGHNGPGHRAAAAAHMRKPFHSRSAFYRLRPLAVAGRWDGCEPLAEAIPAA
jgi:hypothetical protein